MEEDWFPKTTRTQMFAQPKPGVARPTTVATTHDHKEVIMKTQTLRTNEMTLRPVLGRPNSKQQRVMKARNRLAAIGVLLATLLFALPGFAQLIQNGSFETPTVPDGSLTNFFSGSTGIPGWTVVGGPGAAVAIFSTSFGEPGVSFPAQNGQQWLNLAASGNLNQLNVGVEQTVHTISGELYALSYYVGNSTGAPQYWGTYSTVNVQINHVQTCSSKNALVSPTTLVWQQFTCTFTASSNSTTVSFLFLLDGDPQNTGLAPLDHVVLTRVPHTGGTWTPESTPFPGSGAGSALLLTDGRVLVHSEQTNPADWYTLTPNAFGDYIKGTWTKVASLTNLPAGYCYAPLAFASAVLPDGRVIVEGGEDNIPPGCPMTTQTNKGAIYDPVADQWSKVDPPPGWTTIGDAQSAVLPDGTFMLADSQDAQNAEMTAPYLGGSSWVPTGTFKHDLNDEEGWTLLPGPPDAEVLLTVDTSGGCGLTGSEMYINGYWFCIADTPTQLWGSTLHEMGPAVLRPDGTVFQAGGTTASGSGQSAIFDDSTFQWTQGPDFPNDSNGNPLDIADGPAALLPNGNVLMMTSPGNGSLGAVFFELRYGANNLVKAPAPPKAPKDASFYGHMLILPTGQIFFTDFSKDVEIYTPTDQGYSNSWRPVVKHINNKSVANCIPPRFPGSPPPPCLIISQNGPNTLDGLQLNGLSQGAAYGDDYQSATNYPLVTITEIQEACFDPPCQPPPHVYYCRTHDHDNMGVATGNLLVSTKFECPKVPKNFVGYLDVVANGISGGGITVTVK